MEIGFSTETPGNTICMEGDHHTTAAGLAKFAGDCGALRRPEAGKELCVPVQLKEFGPINWIPSRVLETIGTAPWTEAMGFNPRSEEFAATQAANSG